MASVQTEDMNSIVKLLADSPPVKAALSAREAERTLARRGVIAQIKALDRNHQRRYPQLDAELAAGFAVLKEAEATLAVAQKVVNAGLCAKSSARFGYTAERDRLEFQLRETAHQALDPFIRDMRDELDRTRKRFQFIQSTETVNAVTGLTRRFVINNAESVGRRVAAVMAAIDEAERLKVELADQIDIPKILGEMAAAFPVVEDPK